MAKKATKKKAAPVRPQLGDNVEILSAGEVIESPITDTLGNKLHALRHERYCFPRAAGN